MDSGGSRGLRNRAVEDWRRDSAVSVQGSLVQPPPMLRSVASLAAAGRRGLCSYTHRVETISLISSLATRMQNAGESDFARMLYADALVE